MNKKLIIDALYHARYELDIIDGVTVQDGTESFVVDVSVVREKLNFALDEFPEAKGKFFSTLPFAEQN